MIYRKKLRILSIPINRLITSEKMYKVEIYLKLFNLHLQKQTRINFILKKEADILSYMYYCNQSVFSLLNVWNILFLPIASAGIHTEFKVLIFKRFKNSE